MLIGSGSTAASVSTRYFGLRHGAVFGLISVLTLIGLRGEPRRIRTRPPPSGPCARRSATAISGCISLVRTQYFAYTAINLFLVLFFRDRLGLSSGQLVLLIALVPLGGALGNPDRGMVSSIATARAIRVTLQGWRVVLLLSLLLLRPGIAMPIRRRHHLLPVGLLFQSSIAVGSIYMLNPSARPQENYMTLARASDGIIGGGATFRLPACWSSSSMRMCRPSWA